MINSSMFNKSIRLLKKQFDKNARKGDEIITDTIGTAPYPDVTACVPP